MQSDHKAIYNTFYSNSKVKKLLMKMTLIMCLNETILQLHQKYKNL